MKISFNLLKCIVLLLIISLASSCSDSNGRDNKHTPGVTTSSFFIKYLEGKESIYEQEEAIDAKDIQLERKNVWALWIEANDEFSEEKLIPLESLTGEKSSRWKLPENLEPNATMPYYWGYKGSAQPQDGYPLFLYTHGSGNKENEWRNGITMTQKWDDAPSVYFIPQIPNVGDYYRWWQKSKQFAWEKLLRLAFVSGQINADKVYFLGISEGGYGSQRLASFYADYLAAAGPMAGGEPLKNAPVENCKNIAFSLRTGADDTGFYRNDLTQYTKDEFEKLAAKYPNSYTNWIELIPNKQHSIDYAPTASWLKQFKRNPYPKHVIWENFEMDGVYRNGFYNLAISERSNKDESTRTHYDMQIDGNNITLNVDLVTYQTIEVDPQWGIEKKFEKSYQPATSGKITVYLCPELVDLDKEISLTVNGKATFEGMVKLDRKHLINSCAIFFDPARLYPAAIEVDLSK